MSKKTHWKILHNPDYFGAYILLDLGTDLTVTFKDVKRETLKLADGKTEEHTVAYLHGQKPWILNSINQKTISKVVGSPFVDDWIGKSVTLYTEKVRAFGDTVDAVRVRKVAPKIQLPELTPSHKRWAGAVKAVADKSTTIADIKRNFTLTPANEKKLQDEASAV